MEDSTKTTVYLNRSDYVRLQQLARRRGRPAAELVREAVAEYVRRYAPPAPPLSLGVGNSKRGDLSERAEELLEGMGEE